MQNSLKIAKISKTDVSECFRTWGDARKACKKEDGGDTRTQPWTWGCPCHVWGGIICKQFTTKPDNPKKNGIVCNLILKKTLPEVKQGLVFYG